MAECGNCGHANADRARFCNACGAALPASGAAEHVRKTVTVLFSDVVGSTELGDRLDPEAVSRVFSDYFAEIRPLIERHGGTVAKFMGDAVMAVFGVPTLHEDDALRAVRAALDMRSAVEGFNVRLERSYGFTLETRTGIHTGAVAGRGVVPDVDFVGGDTANVAARLQTAADSGTILVSDATYRLVREAIEGEPLAPIDLRGKALPLSAFRVTRVRADAEAVPRRLDAPLVDRTEELARLEREYARAAAGRCRLVTVVGTAGVGKSRLAREFVEVVAADAQVLVGRCLPYGDGITYWPVAEMVRGLAGVARSDGREEAQAKIAAACGGAEEGATIAKRLGELVGLTESSADSAEMFLAVRRLFEHVAARGPLVAAFDDVQWAEPTLLDLIEYVATHARGAPIVVVCLARPDLLESRPTWGGVPGAATLKLQPFGAAESEELLSAVAGADLEPRVAEQIVAATGGNPLFVEQLVSMLFDEGRLRKQEDRWTAVGELDAMAMPSTVQAVLAARFETLEPDERQTLGRAAVIGQIFDLPALEVLAPDDVRLRLPGILTSLVRKELLRPFRSRGRDSFRFRHLLIRDAAYERLTKEQRADLHERFAQWLYDASGARASEYEEIVGYHLEQAYQCRVEVVGVDADTQALAVRAADLLTAAARRAFARGDMPAAARLFGRAAALLERDPERLLPVLSELGKARRFAGDRPGAEAAVREAVELATARGDRCAQLLARVEEMSMRLYTDPGVAITEALAVGEAAVRAFRERGDDRALAQAWSLIGHANWLLCQGAPMEQAFEKALDHTQKSGVLSEWGWMLSMLGVACYWGPTPVERAIARCSEVLRLGRGHGAVEISTRVKLAGLEAMRGRFDVARELYRASKAIGEELGLRPRLAAVGNYSGPIEMLAGDYAAAERELRTACALFEEFGETATLSTSAAYLARALELQGRLDEAEQFMNLSAATAAPEDAASQFLARAVRARVLARRGDLEEAKRIGREAVELAARTDFLSLRGEILLDFSEVMRLTGDADESAAAADEALDLFEAKGNVMLAQRAQAIRDDVMQEARRA